MELSASIKASLPGRYASALFDLASEAGNVTAVESDLEKLAAALGESAELRALISSSSTTWTTEASDSSTDHGGPSSATKISYHCIRIATSCFID